LAFVPTRPVLGPSEQVWPELRRTGDGRLVLVAYTSLAALVSCCGRDQPWVLVPVDWFERMRAECRFEAVCLNVVLPIESSEDWPGKPEEWDD
jgi:hypothetical protein